MTSSLLHSSRHGCYQPDRDSILAGISNLAWKSWKR